MQVPTFLLLSPHLSPATLTGPTGRRGSHGHTPESAPPAQSRETESRLVGERAKRGPHCTSCRERGKQGLYGEPVFIKPLVWQSPGP